MKLSHIEEPPSDLFAEQFVLGAMLLDAHAAQNGVRILTALDFYRLAHATIFSAMQSLHDEGLPVDMVTLRDALVKRDALEEVGGLTYLMQLGEAVPTTAHLEHHAQIVREKAIRRRLLESAARIDGMARAEGIEGGTDTILEAVRRDLDRLTADYSATREEESRDSVRDQWPDPPEEKSFSGLAGDIVRAIEPHTESDPAAILMTFMSFFGNVIGEGSGRGPFYRVEGTEHHANLFVALVGSSSTGRKGTSVGYIRELFQAAVPEWTQNRIHSGLSSGEGFIYAVRDGRDAGDDDNRLLVMESELASVLRVMERDGNTISARLRDAWDSGNLQTLTKTAPLKATSAHVSLIGHITPEELLRYLTRTESANGFANRFLWICVRRSKLLPDGGDFQSEPVRASLIYRLRQAIEFAKGIGEVKRDEMARAVWHHIYPELTAEIPGLLGSVISRAAPQVLRLSLIYALLDCSDVIRAPHLRAAYALWDYAERSAKFIFGQSMGDPTADEIFRALCSAGETGMTRKQISDLFARNKSAEQIGAALETLRKAGKAISKNHDTAGRPATVWFAVKKQ